MDCLSFSETDSNKYSPPTFFAYLLWEIQMIRCDKNGRLNSSPPFETSKQSLEHNIYSSHLDSWNFSLFIEVTIKFRLEDRIDQ